MKSPAVIRITGLYLPHRFDASLGMDFILYARYTDEMIGPHEGKELELMRKGQKKFALFHDVLPEQGDIAEDIIPEKAFSSYIQKGEIKRFSEDIKNKKTGDIIRYVCFALPGEEWRAQFLLWFKRQFLEGKIAYDASHEYIIGYLLGYNETDIEDFLRSR